MRKRFGNRHIAGLLLPCLAIPAAAAFAREVGPQPPLTAMRAGFGTAVAVLDNEVFVGESRNSMRPGIVYVYRKSGSAWSEHTQLKAADAKEGDGFGSGLAVHGQFLAVGAASQNAAFVFQKQANGAWRQVARVAPPEAVPGMGFGNAMALSGDILLVGAPTANQRAGAVYVFRRDASGAWSDAGRLSAANVSANDMFGAALLIEGNRVFVGAPGTNTGAGTVYTFALLNGTFVAQGAVAPQGTPQYSALGSSLRLAGDRLFIGAPNYDSGSGSVVVVQWNAQNNSWSPSGTRLLPFEGGRAQFGMSIAIVGNTVWVGAPGGFGTSGSVYVFERNAAEQWSTARRLFAPDARRGASFANAIAAAGNVVVVGAAGQDQGAGTAAIFEAAGSQPALVESPAESLAPITGRKVDCTNEKVALFECHDVDLLGFLPVSAIGGGRGVRTSGMWGWTDPQTGKEYALVGRQDGAAFVDISNPSQPVYVGQVLRTDGSPPTSWREIKVYKDHAFIVSDAAGAHGIQIFDLTRLREFKGTPISFTPDTRYDRVNSVHNVVINEESGFAYAVGSSSGGETCGGGLHMIDVREPKSPKFVGCFADAATGRAGTGYTHDAQCVTYKGPDADHKGREICLSANETALSIQDVTDKQSPRVISRASYPNVGYTHQGWLTDDHRYFYVNDELDETGNLVQNTRTLVWDLIDLDDPQLVKEFFGSTRASDHNLYVKGNLVYQSNYVAGLRILDITDPRSPVEVAWFDTAPFGPNNPGFSGSWSNYPFFKSGVIAVVSGGEGLFILKKRETRPVS
jgi:choice-of-anchor B domain-containing protein